MNDLTDDMKAMLSPEELAAISDTPEPEAKPEPTQTIAPAFPVPAPEVKAPEPAAVAEPAPEAVAGEIDPVFDDDAPMHIPIGDIDKLKAEKATVAEKLEAVALQAEGGDISAADALRQSSALTAQLGELAAAIRSEERAVEQNAAAMTNFYQRSIDKFMAQKENGDYYVKDTPQYAALDTALKIIGQSPENQSKSLAWVIRESDRVARAMTQSAAPAQPAAPTKPPAPDRRQTVPIPTTIAAIPPSSEESIGSEFSYIDNLTGVAREQALAKLTHDQMSRYAAFA